MTVGAARRTVLRLGLARGHVELLRFVRNRDAVVFTFALPSVLLVLLGSVFGGQTAGGSGVTAGQVLAAGMVAAGVMSTTFVSLGLDIATDRDDGTLKRLRGTPMPAPAYLLGKVVLVGVTTVAQTALLLVVATQLFGLALPDAGGWVVFGWVLALGVVGCSLLGAAISAAARTARSALAVTQLPYLALLFLSGVFVTPVTALPAGLVAVASLFPVRWMAQGFRSVFLPDDMARFEVTGAWELDRVALVLGAWCVAGLVLCLILPVLGPRRP